MGKYCDNPECKKIIERGDYAVVTFEPVKGPYVHTAQDKEWGKIKGHKQILCEECAREAMETIGFLKGGKNGKEN